MKLEQGSLIKTQVYWVGCAGCETAPFMRKPNWTRSKLFYRGSRRIAAHLTTCLRGITVSR
jgi:hypothetical protein